MYLGGILVLPGHWRATFPKQPIPAGTSVLAHFPDARVADNPAALIGKESVTVCGLLVEEVVIIEIERIFQIDGFGRSARLPLGRSGDRNIGVAFVCVGWIIVVLAPMGYLRHLLLVYQ